VPRVTILQPPCIGCRARRICYRVAPCLLPPLAVRLRVSSRTASPRGAGKLCAPPWSWRTRRSIAAPCRCQAGPALGAEGARRRCWDRHCCGPCQTRWLLEPLPVLVPPERRPRLGLEGAKPSETMCQPHQMARHTRLLIPGAAHGMGLMQQVEPRH